ncbi:MAG: ABC transporter ATP-binding protein [Bacillota bacterium]|nr:ABC transporter ATP-binding protein [Bacillota bacterium]
MELKNISKIYNLLSHEVKALDDVSIEIESGEIVSVIGQSGSGKSTLMNILGCLDTPTKGEYCLNGRDVGKLSERELSVIRNRTIGFIFQSFNLVPTLSALENVELPLIYRGISRAERQELAKEALLKVGLSERMKHRPRELSGGQQQRVAIARALAANPPVILADEPTGNLDTACGTAVMEILLGLQNEGKTVILITHDKNTADLAGRKICIQDGKILP